VFLHDLSHVQLGENDQGVFKITFKLYGADFTSLPYRNGDTFIQAKSFFNKLLAAVCIRR
jgi:hypothetical protein